VTTDEPCFDDTDCEMLGECSVSGDDCDVDADCPAGETCIGGGETCVGGGTTTCDIATCDHVIPTYAPSLVTPHPAGGEEGTCDFCHAPGIDTDTGTIVHDSHDTHHHAGLTSVGECAWCHQDGRPGRGDPATEIRTCENCHGYESLHNIQADSDDPADGIEVGGEAYGYGHIGIDNPGVESDCWGCHAFTTADASAMGSGVPSIGNAVPASITAGTPTQVTVTGAALTSTVPIAVSDVRLTATDGSVTTITPDSITGDVLTVTINAAAGSYSLQAVKDGEASNTVAFSVMPQVAITEMDCSKCLGTMTIQGVNFAVKPDGTDEDISVTEGGRSLNVIDWSDTEITLSGARCRGDVVVNGVFGSSN
jgi:hypothetical protein